MPAVTSTSDHLHCELVRILFYAHRETDESAASGVQIFSEVVQIDLWSLVEIPCTNYAVDCNKSVIGGYKPY